MKKRGLLCWGLAVIFFSVLISTAANGENSFASRPTELSTEEGIYHTELYSTSFTHIDDILKIKNNPNGVIGVINNQLNICNPVITPGDTYIETRPIDYRMIDVNTYHKNSYEVNTQFRPLMGGGTWFEFFVLYNGDIDIRIEEIINPPPPGPIAGIWAYSDAVPGNRRLVMDVFEDDLDEFHTFNIYSYADNTQPNGGYYTLTLNDNVVFSIGNPMPFQSDTRSPVFSMGGRSLGGGGSGIGEGLWNYFNVHGCSNANFFDNFQDGSINDWSDFHHNELSEIRVAPADPQESSSKQLKFDTHKNALGGLIGWLDTSYIDYDPDNDYRIEIDFILGSNQYMDFILLYNGQIKIILDNGFLKCDDGTTVHTISALQINHWYFLVACRWQGTNNYDIFLDYENLGQYSFYSLNNQDWLPCIRMGDFDKINAAMKSLFIDNLKLIGEITSDGDSDGLSSNFEQGIFYQTTSSKILVWSDDFESSLDMEVYGWNDNLYHGPNHNVKDGYQNHVWEKKSPSSAYNGNCIRQDPIKGFLGGIDGNYEATTNGNVLCTNNDDDYIDDLDDHVDTPEINLLNVDDIRLVFWHWYDTEPDVDGGQVRISTNGGTTFITLGTASNFYNADDVGCFMSDSVTDAFSGNSNGWVRAEISLSPTYEGESIILRFVFRSDDQYNDYPGWYIDNIRIYGSSKSASANTDSDNVGGSWPGHSLNDGDEFYLFGTSPFIHDTDGDYLRDNYEVLNVELCDIRHIIQTVPVDDGKPWYQNWINGVADPQARDIFIEFDAMTGKEPLDNSAHEVPQISDSIDEYDDHGVTMHIVYSDVNINNDDYLTRAELLNLYSSKMTLNRKKIYFWCLFAEEWNNDPDVMGYALTEVDCRLVLFMDKLRDDAPLQVGGTFMHEMGHCLGLDDYRFNENWQDPPGDPGYTSMIISVNGGRCYFEEYSDIYWDAGTSQRYLGGWEFACRDDSKSVWRQGLCYLGYLEG